MKAADQGARRALLLVYGPGNLIMGLAAHRALLAKTALDVLLCGPSAVTDPVLRRMAGACPGVASIFSLSWERLAAMAPFAGPQALFLPRSWLARLAGGRLRRALRGRHYDTVLYPHDVVGQAVGLARAAWPEAKLLWLGDCFGLFVEKNIHLGLFGVSVPTHPFLPGADPDRAVASLPTDQTGQLLDRLPLTVVSRHDLLETIQQVAGAFPELPAYLGDLWRGQADRPEALLMTENHAETGSIGLEQEIAMYADLLRSLTREGSVVYVKGHPGESLPRHERLAAALAGRCRIVSLVEPFRSLPVEFMPELVLRCDPCISLSYPSLSLKYLYGKDVLNPGDRPFVERWFEPRMWASYENAYHLYEEPRRALKAWDGHSVLWSGTLPPLEPRP